MCFISSWNTKDSRLNFFCVQEKACELVRSIGENVILKKVASEGLAFAEKPRKSKKQVRPSVCSKKGTLPLVVINGIESNNFFVFFDMT